MPVLSLKHTIRLSATALACLVVASCATLNENQCLYADWYAIGEVDGNKGYTMDRLGRHSKACADVAVVPDREAYAAGREKGERFQKNFAVTPTLRPL